MYFKLHKFRNLIFIPVLKIIKVLFQMPFFMNDFVMLPIASSMHDTIPACVRILKILILFLVHFNYYMCMSFRRHQKQVQPSVHHISINIVIHKFTLHKPIIHGSKCTFTHIQCTCTYHTIMLKCGP